MAKYPFMWVDAFTDKPLGGNPCAILFDTDGMPDDKMLAIAKQMNLSETSFVYKSPNADFGARYFTPVGEIPLAGHPTIATIFALIDSGRLRLMPPRQEVTLELKAGIIKIEIYSQGGEVQNIVMSQKKPQFLSIFRPEEILPIFGLTEKDTLENAPIQTVSTGTPQLMIPVRDLECLKRIYMDVSAYRELKERSDFFSPHLFCLQGISPGTRTFARHPGMPPDTLEDPFTGSATGGMAAFLWRYGLIDTPKFIAEQGHWMGRPGRAEVEIFGPRENIETVQVGGQAVTIVRGEIEV